MDACGPQEMLVVVARVLGLIKCFDESDQLRICQLIRKFVELSHKYPDASSWNELIEACEEDELPSMPW